MFQKVSWVFHTQMYLLFNRPFKGSMKKGLQKSLQRISENVILKDSQSIELSFSNRFSSQRKYPVLQYTRTWPLGIRDSAILALTAVIFETGSMPTPTKLQNPTICG